MKQLKTEKKRNPLGLRFLSWGVHLLDRLAAWIFIGLIGFYRLLVSPVLHSLLGANSGCRHEPSCSRYALECFRTHPAPVALYYSVRRVLRCHPLNPGGYDPVPPRKGSVAGNTAVDQAAPGVDSPG